MQGQGGRSVEKAIGLAGSRRNFCVVECRIGVVDGKLEKGGQMLTEAGFLISAYC